MYLQSFVGCLSQQSNLHEAQGFQTEVITLIWPAGWLIGAGNSNVFNVTGDW